MRYVFLIFFILFFSNLNAADNEVAADVYKITITKLELCETGSSDSNCSNPVTIYSGDSGEIDIASTTAGSSAANLGALTSATIGTVYTYMQVTLERAIKISGGPVGARNCYTATAGTDANGNDKLAGGSATSTDQAEDTLYAGIATTGLDTQINSAADANGGSAASAGTITGSHSHFQWRQPLVSAFTYNGISNPEVTVAFGTATALGVSGDPGSNCNTSIATAVGMYANYPDITITIK